MGGAGRTTPSNLLGSDSTPPPQLTSALTSLPAPRPASMDLLRLQCLEVSRDTTRPPAAFSHQDLPQTSPTAAAAQPSTGPEATYSNVGLAAIPRASLAASPVVWAGAGLTSSCAGDEPEARSVVAEYACIHKLKGTGRGPQGLDQGKAQGTPATQVRWRWWGGVQWVELGRSLAELMMLSHPWWASSRWIPYTPGSASLKGGTQDLP